MTGRALLSCLLSLTMLLRIAAADEIGKEIGFVESFDDRADTFIIHRGDQQLPIALLAPILSGDRIEVRKPDAKAVLRLVGRSTPVIVSRNNQDTPLVEMAPARTFWQPIVAWAAQQINIFDREDRDPVSANIRGAGGFSAPILKTPQTLPSGNASLVVGWLGNGDVNIKLYDEASKMVVSGRGSGGVWTSPRLSLQPGKYVLDLAAGNVRVRQALNVLSPSSMPTLPGDLTSDAVPSDLRELTIAVWLAGLDRQYLLAALQRVAPLSRDFSPAALLTRALVWGARPERFPLTAR